MKKRKYVREKPLAEAEADPPGRQALEGGANEPLMLPEGRTAGQKLLPEPEQKKLLTAGDADEKTMMSAFAENTGQARGSTEINTEAPEIEGGKGGKGQATGQATQGGKDTLGLEGARDAEAKDFAMIVEAPEADNKVMAPDGNAPVNLPNMEVGSGAPAIDSGRIKEYLNRIQVNASHDIKADEVNSWWKNEKGYNNAPYVPESRVIEFELPKTTTYVRVYDGEISTMFGSWIMRAEDIQGLSTLEIKDKFALPCEPKYICDVELPSGTKLRIGIANSVEQWGKGGGVQMDLMGQYVGTFKNERLLKQ